MDISKLTDDSVFKKKEQNIQHYIALIQDQKFFDQMRTDSFKDRNLLKNLGTTESKPQTNPYSSKYGKSKSVSWREGGDSVEDQKHEASEDFGESEADNPSRYTKKGHFPEVPHNDSKAKKRDKFMFSTVTRSSQQSETQPARKAPKKDRSIIKEIEVKPNVPDDTRSEGKFKLPSISKQDIDVSHELSRAPSRPKQAYKEDKGRPVSAIKNLPSLDKKKENQINQAAPEINLDKLIESDSQSGKVKTNTTKKVANNYYDRLQNHILNKDYSNSTHREEPKPLKPQPQPQVKPEPQPPVKPEPKQPKPQPQQLLRQPTTTTTKRDVADEFIDSVINRAASRSQSRSHNTGTTKQANDYLDKLLTKAIDRSETIISKEPSKKSSLEPPKQLVRTKTVQSGNSLQREADSYYDNIVNEALDKTNSVSKAHTVKSKHESSAPTKPLARTKTIQSITSLQNAADDYYNQLRDEMAIKTMTDKSLQTNGTKKLAADEFLDKLEESVLSKYLDLPPTMVYHVKTEVVPPKDAPVIVAFKIEPLFFTSLIEKAPYFKKPKPSSPAIDSFKIQPLLLSKLLEKAPYFKATPGLNMFRIEPLLVNKIWEKSPFIKATPINKPFRVESILLTKIMEKSPYIKAIPVKKHVSILPAELRKVTETLYYKRPIPPKKHMPIVSEFATKALDSFDYRLPEKKNPKTRLQSADKQSNPILLTETDSRGRALSRERIKVVRDNSPESEINFSQIDENVSSLDKMANKNKFKPRDSLDKGERFNVPPVKDSSNRGPVRNSITNVQNSSHSLQQGINDARSMPHYEDQTFGRSRDYIDGELDRQRREMNDLRSESQVPYYSAEEMARVREQIKASIQGMFDLRNDSPDEDVELTNLIGRFYHLMMDEKHILSRDKAEIIIDLVTFYQKYLSKLKEENRIKMHKLELKDSTNRDERDRNRELEREIQNLRMDLKDAHEDRLETVKKMTVIDIAKKKNDEKVKEIELKYEQNIEKFKDLLRNVNEEFLNAKKHEIHVTDKLNHLQRDYEMLFHENIRLKSEVTNMDYKDKERQFEVERLMADLKGQITRNEALLRERDVFGNRIRDYQMRMAELESANIEIENFKARENELARKIETMRSEMRNKDLTVMEMQHKINYNENVKNLLLEENTRIVSHKEREREVFNAKMNDMEGNLFSKNYQINRLQQSGRTIKKTENVSNRNIESANRQNIVVQGRVLRNPIIHSMNTPFLGGDAAPKREAHSPTTTVKRASPARFGSHKNMSESEIKAAIQEYNSQLYHYQDKKMILDSMLCRLPANPKNHKERQLKDSLEGDYSAVTNKIAEYKKLLRDLKAL